MERKVLNVFSLFSPGLSSMQPMPDVWVQSHLITNPKSFSDKTTKCSLSPMKHSSQKQAVHGHLQEMLQPKNTTLQPLNLREKRQDKDGQVHSEEIRTILFTPTQLRTWLLTEMVEVIF